MGAFAFSPAILVFLKGISITYYAQIILKSLGGIWIIGHFVKKWEVSGKASSDPPDLSHQIRLLLGIAHGPVEAMEAAIGWRKIQQGSCKWFFLHAWLVHNFPVFLYHGNLYKGPTRPHSPMPYAPESWWLITLRWGVAWGGMYPSIPLGWGSPPEQRKNGSLAVLGICRGWRTTLCYVEIFHEPVIIRMPFKQPG